MPLPIAVVGAGSMAREHLRAFADVPGVELAGLFSRTREKAERLAAEFGIGVVAGGVDELFERTAAGLVVVTVSGEAMRDAALACMVHPWTLLLEKPPGLDVAEAEEIRRAAAAAGRTVLVGLNRRFLSSTQAVLDDLADVAGRRSIVVQDQEDQAAARAAGFHPRVVETWRHANAIHTIDYLRCFGRGEVTAVRTIEPWRPEAPGIVLAKVEFAGGDVGLYEGIWNGPGPWAVAVSTPTRRWELRPLEQAAVQRAGERKSTPAPRHEWDERFKPGLRRQAEEASAAALGRPHRAVTLDDGLATMRLIDAIFRTEQGGQNRMPDSYGI